MKGIALSALMIVGILLFAGIAIGVNYSKYGEVTTTVEIDDGLTCTINGKEVSNGDTVTVDLEFCKLKVCVNSDAATLIACSGDWSSDGDRVSFSDGTDSEVTCAEFTIDFGKAASFNGIIVIDKAVDDLDHDPISLYFTYDDKIVVRLNGNEVASGTTLWYKEDIDLEVITVDGEEYDIHWYGSYRNHYDTGDKTIDGSGHWSSGTIHLECDNYFSTATGKLTIDVS